MSTNIFSMTDSYKPSHYWQTPPGTEYVNMYAESRNHKIYDNSLFFGLQAYLKEYLVGKIFTNEVVDEAIEILTGHIPKFNIDAFRNLINKHNGVAPVEIWAVPEGSIVPNGNVLFQIRNTHPDAFWLPSFLDPSLIRAMWYPSTVATFSYNMRKIIESYLNKTSDNTDSLLYKLHDFGTRGVSSHESSGLGGLAHCVSFRGTDNIAALFAGKKYYNSTNVGYSIPAAEHYTITSWGKDKEEEAYDNMLNHFAQPGSVVAIVSDSYDIENACKYIWGGSLKQKVIDSGATVVIRPDSGDPIETPVNVIEILLDKFGYSTNSKGYQVLNNVRVIQGDGIGRNEILSILHKLCNKRISTENISFGAGDKLLQNHHRDDLGMSMKCSECIINGKSVDVFKESPGKKSKKGRLALVRSFREYKTIRESDLLKIIPDFTKSVNEYNQTNILRPIFRNGKLLIDDDLETIRRRVDNYKYY